MQGGRSAVRVVLTATNRVILLLAVLIVVGLTTAYGWAALIMASRLGSRLWRATGGLIAVLSLAASAFLGHQPCPRYPLLITGIISWAVILTMVAGAMLAGTYAAERIVATVSRWNLSDLLLAAAATFGGLLAGGFGGWILFVALYGPDCWP